jgi:biopolymer transport protein ExbB/TolQ
MVKKPKPIATAWVDRQGVYALAAVLLIVTVALAVVNSFQYADVARNTAEIEQVKSRLDSLKVDVDDVARLTAVSTTRLKADIAAAKDAEPVVRDWSRPDDDQAKQAATRHEKDIVRIFGILGKPRER